MNPARRRLALQHIAAEARVRKLTVTKVERIWRNLGSYNREDLPRWLEQVIPIVLGAQRQSVVLTDAYLAAAMDRKPLGINAENVIGASARKGTLPEDQWARPMVEHWTALKDGKTWDQARRIGEIGAATRAATDVQLAMRQTAFLAGLQDKNIFGWERVPNSTACDLCLIASTQRYTTEHLLPIHDSCGCGILPLTSSTDQIINRELYRDLKADGAMDRVTAQRVGDPDTVVTVAEHGELGPVLTKAQ